MVLSFGAAARVLLCLAAPHALQGQAAAPIRDNSFLVDEEWPEGVWVGQDGTPPVYVLNPGARFAVNAGALQIVPGFSFPVSLSAHGDADAVLFYLSFEHPLGSPTAE